MKPVTHSKKFLWYLLGCISGFVVSWIFFTNQHESLEPLPSVDEREEYFTESATKIEEILPDGGGSDQIAFLENELMKTRSELTFMTDRLREVEIENKRLNSNFDLIISKIKQRGSIGSLRGLFQLDRNYEILEETKAFLNISDESAEKFSQEVRGLREIITAYELENYSVFEKQDEDNFSFYIPGDPSSFSIIDASYMQAGVDILGEDNFTILSRMVDGQLEAVKKDRIISISLNNERSRIQFSVEIVDENGIATLSSRTGGSVIPDWLQPLLDDYKGD